MELQDYRLSQGPTEIIRDARERFTGISDNIHGRLEIQAINTKFNDGITFKTCMLKQKRLCLQMLQEQYPQIQNEATSVRMALAGATSHLNFITVARMICVAGIQTILRQI